MLDSYLNFDPAGTAITSTAASTNVIDLLNARDLGISGEENHLDLLVVSDGTFASSGSTGTLTIQFEGSVDNSTWTVYDQSPVLTQTQLNQDGNGTRLWPVRVPARPPGAALPRYLRLNYVVASGPFTAGTLQAWIAPQQQMRALDSYPSGFTVSN